MIDFELLSTVFSESEANAKKLQNITQKLNKNVIGISPELLRKDVETAYILAMSAALNMQRAMSLLTSQAETKEIINSLNEEICGVNFDVKVTPEAGIFSCKIFSPPILKTKHAAYRYFELFCLNLEKKIVEILPQNFKRFPAAYVIYLNHFNSTFPLSKQPYFDNDNIAIKGILDAVVPYICHDDAANFCDNIYISQPDNLDFVELFIVKKGCLNRWILDNPNSSFASEIAKLEP